MKAKRPIYCSPKLEIVPFDDEDILTVSTHGGDGDKPNPGGGEGTGSGGTIDWGDLGWG